MAVDANVAAGLRKFGMCEEDIEALQAQDSQALAQAEAGADFEVHEDCWSSVLFFLQAQTQWLYRGMDGQRSGFSNAALESTMRMAGVCRALWPELLADLQVMELAVLQADAEIAEAKGG